MKGDKLDLKKLGVKEITYGEFVAQVARLQQYLHENKNYEGLSVLYQLVPKEILEDMVIQYIAAESFRDNFLETPRGLAIRDIMRKRKKKQNENKKRN